MEIMDYFSLLNTTQWTLWFLIGLSIIIRLVNGIQGIKYYWGSILGTFVLGLSWIVSPKYFIAFAISGIFVLIDFHLIMKNIKKK